MSTPTQSHHHAAAAHEVAMKSHKAAADLHEKGDHKQGLEHAEKASKESEVAHKACGDAHETSKTAAH